MKRKTYYTYTKGLGKISALLCVAGLIVVSHRPVIGTLLIVASAVMFYVRIEEGRR